MIVSDGSRTPIWPILITALAVARFGWAEQSPAMDKVEVVVVEAGERFVYISPGEKKGLRVGQTVVIGKRRYRISAVSSSSARIDTIDQSVSIGAKGTVAVMHPAGPPDSASAPSIFSPPQQLEEFRNQWPEQETPATRETTTQIPSGGPPRSPSFESVIGLSSAMTAELGGENDLHGYGKLSARIHYEPFNNYAVAFDADASTQLWWGMDHTESDGSRPPIQVRQLQGSVGLGPKRNFGIELGRLRYASAQLGMLDGGRVEAPIGEQWRLGAFGGLQPDPIDGQILSNASRFGVDSQWANLTNPARPNIFVAAYGSTFDGELDERRVQTTVGFYPEFGHFQGNLELAFFDDENPWKADLVEVNSAGGDFKVHFGPVEFGGLFQMQRPERTRLLSSRLPLEWFCTTTENAATGEDPTCSGEQISLFYQGEVGVWFSKIAADLRLFGSQNTETHVDQMGASVHTRLYRIAGPLSIDAALSGITGSYYKSAALTLNAGLPLLSELLDLSVRYRPTVNRYEEAGLDWFLDHTIGLTVLTHLPRSIEISLDGDVMLGGDVDAIYLYASVIWRPRVD